MLTSWFLVSVCFFIFLFYHFPRNDHLSRDKITQKNITTKLLLCWHFLCNIFILVFQVYFLFSFDFLFVLFVSYSIDDKALIHIVVEEMEEVQADQEVSLGKRFIVHSASLLAFRKRLCFSESEQIEHWTAPGACAIKNDGCFTY